MTTLITGAGLIGTSFGQIASKRGEKLVFLDPLPREDYLRGRLGDADYSIIVDDVRSLPGLIAAIDAHGVDTILHTAGRIGIRAETPIHEGFGLNLGGVMTLAEAIRLTGVKRLVHISTWGVYDSRRQTDALVDEDFPKGGGGAYSNSKAAQELILEAYQKKFGFELVMLRPANAFGVGHFWAGSGGGEKVQTLLESGIRETVAKIPEVQTMDFVYFYAKNLGRAIELAATIALPEKPVFNLGYDEITTFQQLVDLAKKLLPGLKVEIVPGTPPSFRPRRLDLSHAAEHLGWTPEYTMEACLSGYHPHPLYVVFTHFPE